METHELAGGGLILFDASFLPPDRADRYFAELRDNTSWRNSAPAAATGSPA